MTLQIPLQFQIIIGFQKLVFTGMRVSWLKKNQFYYPSSAFCLMRQSPGCFSIMLHFRDTVVSLLCRPAVEITFSLWCWWLLTHNECRVVGEVWWPCPSTALLQWQIVIVQNKEGGQFMESFFLLKYWTFCKVDDIASCFLMLCYLVCSKWMHLRINWRFLLKYFPAFLSDCKYFGELR